MIIVNLMVHADVGHVFVISGTLEKDAREFKIELVGSESSNSQSALTITADIEKKAIKIKANNECGKEEDDDEEVHNVNAVDDELKFKFYILALDKSFRIALNDEHLSSINYRTDISNVKVAKIKGDIDRVRQVDHRKVYPFCWPQNQEDFPTIAFSSDVPSRFAENTLIILRMVLNGNDDGSFFIRFNELGSKKQLFHFNPRFGEKEIVCNSMNDKLEWKSEMRFPNFPFVLNKEFQMGILMDSSFFHVAVNGHHILKYPFKTVQSTLLRQAQSHSIYDKMTGFKIFALNGLALKVSYVDFFTIQENDTKFYEVFSNLNFV